MAENESEKPKIIVDDDWKAQARAEKEKLAEQVEGRASSSAGGQPAAAQLPPASFATLVGSLTTQVFMSLGGMEDPRTKRHIVDLDLAKHHIDTLAMLEEKTDGHLSDDEKKMLDQALYETRMQYVQLAQQVAGSNVAPGKQQ